MQTFGKDLLRDIKNAELLGENATKFIPRLIALFIVTKIFLTRNPKFAAVNILLYIKDNEWHFPLIVRSVNEKDRHSGQISLPGRKK